MNEREEAMLIELEYSKELIDLREKCTELMHKIFVYEARHFVAMASEVLGKKPISLNTATVPEILVEFYKSITDEEEIDIQTALDVIRPNIESIVRHSLVSGYLPVKSEEIDKSIEVTMNYLQELYTIYKPIYERGLE